MIRRLAAIVAVDVVGFSRLMAVDEDETWNAWSDLRSRIDPLFEQGGGRIVKSTGDGVLVESPSVIEAVKSAIRVQEVVGSWNDGRPSDRAMRLRIGINLGDVIVADDGDVYGDGVNVAARLEALADPGGICLSDSAYQQVRQRIEARFVDRGEQWVKNIPTPIRVWSILAGDERSSEVSLGVSGLEHGEMVGRGGNATVYRAYQRSMDRWVAMKVIDGSDEATRRRFDRERQAMGRLSQHPGIVTIYQSGYTSAGRPFLIMPFLEAGSLQDRLDRIGPMPWEEAAGVVAAVAGAVDHAHRSEIIHRDIKPANIMLDEEGRPLISDFGIARLSNQSATVTDRVALTPAFTPPELLDGSEPTAAVDVYSLAATFCALVTGSPPFITGSSDSDTLLALSNRIAHDPPPDLRPLGVPEAACRAVEAAMAKNPANRPATAREFALALSGEVALPDPQRPPEGGGRAPTTRVGLAIGGTVGIAALVVIGILAAIGDADPPETTTGQSVASTAAPATAPPDSTGGTVTDPTPDGGEWSRTFDVPIAAIEIDEDADCSDHRRCGVPIHVVLADGTVHALDPATGADSWAEPFESLRSPLGPTDWRQAAAVGAGHLYAVRPGSKLVYAIDSDDGGQDWRELLPFDAAEGDPLLAEASGTVFVAFGLGVAALDGDTGDLLWSDPTASRGLVEWISVDGELLVISDGLVVRGLRADDGAQLWQFVAGDRPEWIEAQQYVETSGTGRSFERRALIATAEPDLLLIDGDTGEQRWLVPITQRPGSPPDDVAFAADVDGRLIAIDMATGDADVLNEAVRVSAPPVAAGGSVIVIDEDDLVVLNDRSGTERQRFTPPGRITGTPSVLGDLVVVAIGDMLVTFVIER